MHLMNEENELFLKNYKRDVNEFFAGNLEGEELTKYQNEKLVNILKYVYKNSPYYRKCFENLKDDFEDFTIHRLSEIPFTTKNTLREQGLDILSQPIENNAYYYETTGTTGVATPCPRSLVDVMSSNITISMAYKTVFESIFGERKPVVGIFGPTEVHSFGDTLGNVCHNLDLCAVKAWPYSPVIGFDKSLELIKKLNIEVIMCTPGLSMTLFKAAKSRGYDVKKDFNIKMFMLTGEMCTKPMAENIESLWGAKIFNFMYGSQEALVMATCNKENRMNIFPHNYIYEVVDYADGTSLGFEGEGELVVTMLNPGGKPLIRYRTGDIVRIINNPNSPLPSYEISVQGRVKDKIFLNEVGYKASDFEEIIMSDLGDCLGYQIVIDNDGISDFVQIRLEILNESGKSDVVKNRIELEFYKKFRTKTSVYFEEELDPVVYTGAMVSWKAARIVDKRKKMSFEKLEGESAHRMLEQGVIKTK